MKILNHNPLIKNVRLGVFPDISHEILFCENCEWFFYTCEKANFNFVNLKYESNLFMNYIYESPYLGTYWDNRNLTKICFNEQMHINALNLDM